MRNYELLLIISAGLSEEAKSAKVEEIKTLLEANGAKVSKVDKMGVKKLAYPINYKTEGYYVVYDFESKGETQALVEPKLRIDEKLMRVLFVRK